MELEIRGLLERKKDLLQQVLDKTVAFRRSVTFRPAERDQFADGYSALYTLRKPVIDELNKIQKQIEEYRDKARDTQDEALSKLGGEIDEIIGGIISIDEEMRTRAENTAKEAKRELSKFKKSKNLNTAYMGRAYVESGRMLDKRS